MIRVYMTDIIGTGIDDETMSDPFRPAVADLVSASWSAVDYRQNAMQALGKMLVKIDVDDNDHEAIRTDPRVTYLFAWNERNIQLKDLPAKRRNAIRNWLDERNIDVDHLTGNNSVKDLVQAVVNRALLRQVLRDADFAEHLDTTTIADIPVARRQKIRDRLLARGVDISDVEPTDTIRQALRKILPRSATALRVKQWL